MKTIAAVVLAVAAFSAGPPPPSDPVGLYAIIDRVVLLPDAQAPIEAEIHGAFCIARGAGDYYTAPARGYVLFRAGSKPGEEVQQWRELQGLAGTRKVVGLSSRYEQGVLRVAQPGEARPQATTYPLGWGLQKIEGVDYGPVRELALLPKPLSPLDDSAPKVKAKEIRPARKITFTVENCSAAQNGLQYLFEVETASGDLLASPPVAPGDKTTSWTTTMALLAGDKITWRARVLGGGAERVPVARATFVVGTEPETAR